MRRVAKIASSRGSRVSLVAWIFCSSFWISRPTMPERNTPDIEALLRGPGDRWLHFTRPSHIVQAHQAARVRSVVAAVERAARDRGTHIVGFLTYEAGSAFNLSGHRSPAGLPLAWFAMFDDANPYILMPGPFRSASK